MGEWTHLDEGGRAVMVDISGKSDSVREAVAMGEIRMQEATRAQLLAGGVRKGDVCRIAELAGIMGAKHTPLLIPLCHLIDLAHVRLEVRPGEDPQIMEIEARCRSTGRTGVEMEALTAVSVAALTVYDMCKALDRGMHIGNIRLVAKDGGRSGSWRQP